MVETNAARSNTPACDYTNDVCIECSKHIDLHEGACYSKCPLPIPDIPSVYICDKECSNFINMKECKPDLDTFVFRL